MKTRQQFIPHCLILVLLFTLLFMPMADAAEPKRGGTFVLAISMEPQGLSPYVSTAGDDHCVTSNPFSLLVYRNLDFEIIPGLAESWKVSEDGLTYTFNLAKNATWHDGKPFTSADVLYTFKECLSKNPKAEWWVKIKNSVTLQSPDEHTMVMKLRQPFAPLLVMLATESGGGYVLPKHLYEGTDLRKNPYNNKPIGTGPFMFKEWVKGSHAVYGRNPNYFVRGKPYVDRLVVRFIPDSAGRVLALKKWDPNPDIEKRFASIREDSEAFRGRRALGSLNRLLIPIRLNQRPTSFCNSLSLRIDYPLVLSLSALFPSVFTRLDINSVQRISV